MLKIAFKYFIKQLACGKRHSIWSLLFRQRQTPTRTVRLSYTLIFLKRFVICILRERCDYLFLRLGEIVQTFLARNGRFLKPDYWGEKYVIQEESEACYETQILKYKQGAGKTSILLTSKCPSYTLGAHSTMTSAYEIRRPTIAEFV